MRTSLFIYVACLLVLGLVMLALWWTATASATIQMPLDCQRPPGCTVPMQYG